MCAMAQAYLTEAQMPRDFWFHAIRHTQIPAKADRKLTMYPF